MFIMLNLFILIIIQYFEDYHLKEDNPIQQFNENLLYFRKIWAELSKESMGEKIHQKFLINFFQILSPPLGFNN